MGHILSTPETLWTVDESSLPYRAAVHPSKRSIKDSLLVDYRDGSRK